MASVLTRILTSATTQYNRSLVVNYNEDLWISSLSDGQEQAIVLIYWASTCVSITGSILILRDLWKKARRPNLQYKPKRAHGRILGAMAIYDILFSIHLSLNPLLVPQETSQQVWAVGNDATCNYLGFMTGLGFASVFYNGSLSLYYVLTITGRLSDAQFAKWLEPGLHLLNNLYPLVTATIGLWYGMYREFQLGPGCWINDYPRNCETELDPDTPCTSPFYSWLFAGFPTVVVLIMIVINGIIIFRFVRRAVVTVDDTKKKRTSFLSKSLTNSFRRTSSTNLTTTPASATFRQSSSSQRPGVEEEGESLNDEHEQHQQHGQMRSTVQDSDSCSDDDDYDDDDLDNADATIRSATTTTTANAAANQHRQQQVLRAVAHQSLLYVLAFIFTLGWGLLLRIVEAQEMWYPADDDKMFPFYVITAVCLPLQGGLNYLIYMRPRYLKIVVQQRRSSWSKSNNPQLKKSNSRQQNNNNDPNNSNNNINDAPAQRRHSPPTYVQDGSSRVASNPRLDIVMEEQAPQQDEEDHENNDNSSNNNTIRSHKIQRRVPTGASIGLSGLSSTPMSMSGGESMLSDNGDDNNNFSLSERRPPSQGSYNNNNLQGSSSTLGTLGNLDRVSWAGIALTRFEEEEGIPENPHVNKDASQAEQSYNAEDEASESSPRRSNKKKGKRRKKKQLREEREQQEREQQQQQQQQEELQPLGRSSWASLNFSRESMPSQYVRPQDEDRMVTLEETAMEDPSTSSLQPEHLVDDAASVTSHTNNDWETKFGSSLPEARQSFLSQFWEKRQQTLLSLEKESTQHGEEDEDWSERWLSGTSVVETNLQEFKPGEY